MVFVTICSLCCIWRCKCHPEWKFYLCKGDEEQLFMRVSESRQRSLWTVLPHPLLIGLQTVRPSTMRGRKFKFCEDLKRSESSYYLHNMRAWALPCLRYSPPASGDRSPTHTWGGPTNKWSRSNIFSVLEPFGQPHLLVVNCEIIVEVHDAFGFRLELPVRFLRPPLFEVPVTIVLAP